MLQFCLGCTPMKATYTLSETSSRNTSIFAKMVIYPTRLAPYSMRYALHCIFFDTNIIFKTQQLIEIQNIALQFCLCVYGLQFYSVAITAHLHFIVIIHNFNNLNRMTCTSFSRQWLDEQNCSRSAVAHSFHSLYILLERGLAKSQFLLAEIQPQLLRYHY